METSTVNSIMDLFNELLDKFNSINKRDIGSINSFLEEYSVYFERNIFDAISYNNSTGREYLNSEILKLLNSKRNNVSVGDLIILDSLVNNKKINSLVFYYDSYRCLDELNIDKYLNVNITFNGKDSEMDSSNIYINLDDKDKFRDGDITNLINLRKTIKKYDQNYNRDNKNQLEDYYHEISNYLNNIYINKV